MMNEWDKINEFEDRVFVVSIRNVHNFSHFSYGNILSCDSILGRAVGFRINYEGFEREKLHDLIQ
jgi:hypothetical protein